MRGRFLELLQGLLRSARADRVGGLSAEVAFWGVLGIFPALLLVTAGLGWLDVLFGSDVAAQAEATVLAFLERALTDRGSAIIESVRELFRSDNTQVLTVAALFAFVTLSQSFGGVIRALNIVYGVTEHRSRVRVWIIAPLLALGSVLLAVLLLTMMVVGPLFGGGHEVARWLGFGVKFAVAWDWLRAPLAFLLLLLWATTLYHLAPDRRSYWYADLPGAALAAVLWLVVSFGLTVYLRYASDGNVVFGVLGGALILLVWFDLIGLALLLGGELNAVLGKRR
ncbi:MAG: YihY/virulence factor BrkB family protein [Acidobacteria bacterium]|nr:YihY/virulence factor BrkB family protein [Acidobacteriota bacterium]